ncbi:major capsid and protease fusion protein [Arthrobacter phage GantcherGoblin]|nr:major capsid and protease fusion protein [Arthrobacter phage GantcherGoblin]
MADNKPNFSGWATWNDLECSDGLTIKGGAFKHQDQQKVPLVWQHQHEDPEKVLGHALLENRPEGVYAYAFFNESDKAKHAQQMVEHGDVESLSIYANKLKKRGADVLHGNIKEVSLVLAGANPGALIDNVYLRHGDEVNVVDDEAIIYTGLHLEHGDFEDPESNEEDGEEPDTKEVLESLTEEQQEAVHGLLEAALKHSDGDKVEVSDSEVLETLSEEQQGVVYDLVTAALEHTDKGAKVADNTDQKTVADVFEEMTDEQKNAVYFMLGEVEDAAKGDSAKHSGLDGDDILAHIKEGIETQMGNIFEKQGKTASDAGKDTLSHDDLQTIVADTKKYDGSFKEAFLAHAQEYGIENIDILFPDAKALNSTPDFIKRRTEWVAGVVDGAKHSPFSRIKTIHADITADEARAKGYVKATMKKEEVFKLLKRVTTPTTIYKKQKLDRDDIVDITDLDVVAFVKAEMRLMLDEEIARAILIGDGREVDDPDKINEENLRPIAWDDDMYAHKVNVASNLDPYGIVKAFLRARKNYKGSGQPVLYTTDDILTDMLLIEDKIGNLRYKTKVELAATLRVSDIIPVEAMETVPNLIGIVVNMTDYTIGADKGGQISMFDDFDIDYNQYKYLIETRISGALTKPKSAVVIQRTAGTVVNPTAPTYNSSTHVVTIPTVAGVEYWKVVPLGTDVKVTTNQTITEDTEFEARPAAGYSFPHNIDTDWTFLF